jgi:hypothetical protein
MPVAVSSAKVCGTYVTDIRYREDAADWDKPEDLPTSQYPQLSGTRAWESKGTHQFPAFPFCPLAAVFEVEQATTVFV